MRSTLLALALLCAISVPAAAHADTFDYTFSAVFGSSSFTYDSPVLITTATTIIPLTCTSAGLSCVNVDIDPPDRSITFNLVGGGFEAFGGGPASFFAVGDNVIAGFATLDIVDVPTVSAVPEPSGLVLLGTSFLGLAEVVRRKLAAR